MDMDLDINLDESLGALGRARERNRRAASLRGRSVPADNREKTKNMSIQVKAIVSPTRDDHPIPSTSKDDTQLGATSPSGGLSVTFAANVGGNKSTEKQSFDVRPSGDRQMLPQSVIEKQVAAAKKPEGLNLGPRARNIPQSLEMEHRTIMIQANRMVLEVRSFQNNYKLDGVDAERLQETATEMIDYLRVGSLAASTYNSFFAVLHERKGELIDKKAEDYHLLELVCKRSMQFEDLYKSYRKTVLPCIEDHLKRYCVSHAKEDPEKELVIVHEYEEKCRQLQLRMNEEILAVDRVVDSLRELFVPFVPNYLKNLERITHKFNQVTTLVIDLCELMKRWVSHDKHFPKKLLDEHVAGSSTKSKLQEEVKRCEKRRVEAEAQLKQRLSGRDKVAGKVEAATTALDKVKRERDFLAERVQRSESERQDLQDELKQTEGRIANNQSDTPDYLENMWHRMDMFKGDVKKISDRIQAIHDQMERMDKDLQKKLEDLDVLEKELAEEDETCDDLESEVTSCEAQVAKAKLKVREVDKKCAKAKKIRDIKLSSESLRKLYMESLNVGMSDKDEHLLVFPW